MVVARFPMALVHIWAIVRPQYGTMSSPEIVAAAQFSPELNNVPLHMSLNGLFLERKASI
jgi:hypothetical protein